MLTSSQSPIGKCLPNDLKGSQSDFSDSIESGAEHNCAVKKGKWTQEEDELLRKYAIEFGEKQWRKISQKVPGRTSIQCLHRWTKILKPGLVKGPWTQDEDKKLIEWVTENGPGKWAEAAKFIQGRSGKQCRERWFNTLSPDVKKGDWTKEEDELIFSLYQRFGSTWSQIAKFIPGRTENAVKNRFYSALRKLSTLTKRKTDASLSLDDKPLRKEKNNSSLEFLEDGKQSKDVASGKQSAQNSDIISEKQEENLYFETYASIRKEIKQETQLRDSKQSEIKLMSPLKGTQKNEITPKKNYYKSKQKFNRKKSDKLFESFMSLQDSDLQNSISPTKLEVPTQEKFPDFSLNTHLKKIPQPGFSFSDQSTPDVFTEKIYNNPHNSQDQFNILKPSTSYAEPSFDSRIHNRLSTFETELTAPQLINSNNCFSSYQSLGYINNDFLSEKISFARYVLDSASKYGPKIMDECMSKNINEITRINNLINLLTTFADHNVDTLVLSTKNQALRNGITEKVLDDKLIRTLITDIYEATNFASNVHCNYIRHLLDINNNLPFEHREEASKRMEYLFCQLSSLESTIGKVRSQMTNLQSSLYSPLNALNPQKLRYEDFVPNLMSRNEEATRQAMKIKIGTLNSGFEEISKKRILM